MTKEVVKNAVVSGFVGGAAGATTYGVMGGIGLAAAGTAVSVTLGPFIAVGVGLGAFTYGVFSLGRRCAARI